MSGHICDFCHQRLASLHIHQVDVEQNRRVTHLCQTCRADLGIDPSTPVAQQLPASLSREDVAQRALIHDLHLQLEAAVAQEAYEKAAILRDQIAALEQE